MAGMSWHIQTKRKETNPWKIEADVRCCLVTASKVGPGRPGLPEEVIRKNRSIKMSDAEWEKIKSLAAAKGLPASDFIRYRTLGIKITKEEK